MTDSLAELLAILDLDNVAPNTFRAVSQKNGWRRVFGGQVVAQALVAATRTVDQDHRAHSLHANFLLGGDPKAPIVYEVDPVRDGGSFTTRLVKALQQDRTIFVMTASFHREEDGFEHALPMPDVPSPERLSDAGKLVADAGTIVPSDMMAYFSQPWPIEMRPVESDRYLAHGKRDPRFNVWLKAAGRLPDDDVVHRAVLAYASDMTLLDATTIAHGTTVFDPRIQSASLDHALWLHRSFRMDDWLLYAQDSPSTSGARGFARGSLFDRNGRLVASVAQEGLLRRKTR